MLSGLGGLWPSTVGATENPVHSVNFFSEDTGPLLVEPGRVEVGPEGTLAVWDRTLQRFFYETPPDTSPGDTVSTQPKSYGRNSVPDDLHTGMILKKWGLDNRPSGFFDSEGTFWFYDRSLSDSTDTFSLQSNVPTRRRRSLPGPVRSLVPVGDQLIAQSANDTKLQRHDPYSGNTLVDTATHELKGNLVGFTRRGQYLTQHGNTLRSYEGGEQRNSRSFSSVQDVELLEDDIFILSGNGELVRLDLGLTAQFTFFLPPDRNYRSMAIREDTLYVTSDRGLHYGQLDESQRSFFSQSARVELRRIAGTLPEFKSDQDVTPRLWVRGATDSVQLKVHREEQSVRELSYDTGGFRSRGTRSMDGLSTNPFQFFQVDSTYWNGMDSLYYYFPDERAVEQYDTSGRLVRRRDFSFEQEAIPRDVRFVGANDTRVFFRAEYNDRDRGYTSKLLLYDWDGNRRRVVDPSHPFVDGDYGTTRETRWRYAGGSVLYELHSNYIQLYDMEGYPARTINNVYEPVDVVRSGDRLFVLDLNGARLRSFEAKSFPRSRFGLPYEALTVSGAASSGNQTIFTGRSPDDEKLSLYSYDNESLEYEEVLRHPRQSLRYPFYAQNGDTVYFTGRRTDDSRWTLYRSDTLRYSARPLAQLKSVRGMGFHDSERNLLFVPVDSDADTAPRYRYVSPSSDTVASLDNSHRLEDLVPGGFAGMYALRRNGDTYSVVSGYLNRPRDTRSLRWNRVETLYQSDRPLRGLTLHDEQVFFVEASGQGSSRLARLRPEFAFDGDTTTDERVVRDLGEFRGEVRFVHRRSDHLQLLLRTGSQSGQFLRWYPKGSLGTGGIQGQVTVPDPADLSGIELRVSPSGRTVSTRETGRFSLSDVPTGYVGLKIPSYRYHFQYPVNLPVRSGEYTVESSLPMVQQEELLLLESGLDYLRQDRPGRSRIPFNAFRELVNEGPFHRWTDGILEVLNRDQGDTSSQFDLFAKRPELFDPRETMQLLRSAKNIEQKQHIYRRLDGLLESNLRTFLRYRREVLRQKSDTTSRDAGSLTMPLTGGRIPALGELRFPDVGS